MAHLFRLLIGCRSSHLSLWWLSEYISKHLPVFIAHLHNVKTDTYQCRGQDSSGIVCTGLAKPSRPAHTRVWGVETESIQSSLFSGWKTITVLWEHEHEAKLLRHCESVCFTCTHPANTECSTCARFFMIRTSFVVESAHWPFSIGLIKRFWNSLRDPRRFFLMKLTMQWSVGT